MELRQLRYFIAVAEELSFTKGAARVHISQPPLSRQIALLEDEVGVPLFERDKHHVALTEAGKAFLPEARKVIEASLHAVGTAVRAARGEFGKLTLAFGGSAAYMLLPEVLRAFRDRFPGVQLSLVHLPLTAHLDAILEDRVDVGTLVMPIREPAIASELLVKEPLVVVLPSGHPLSHKTSVKLAALAPYPQILFNRSGGLGLYAHIIGICRRAGYAPKVAEETSPMESVVGLVASGLGIAIVPAMARRLNMSGVVYLPLEESYASITFALAWRKDNGSPALKALIDITRRNMEGRHARAQLG